MTKEFLNLLETLFANSISQMSCEAPTKIRGEAIRIYNFGFQSFQAGFMYGLNIGKNIADKSVSA